MRRSVAEQAWASAHASAIVAGGRAARVAVPTVGAGIYLGIAAATVLVLFGLTIVLKKVARPYAQPEDDV
jgi:hypothetical protein